MAEGESFMLRRSRQLSEQERTEEDPSRILRREIGFQMIHALDQGLSYDQLCAVLDEAYERHSANNIDKKG